jgi:cytochrome bd-type quinol oxidase subunit 2
LDISSRVRSRPTARPRPSGSLSIADAAAPLATLVSLTVVAAVALVLVVPSVGLLLVLQQRGRLEV